MKKQHIVLIPDKYNNTMKFALITLSILSCASAELVSLTSDNKSTVVGKSVFVKFFAPW